MLEGRPIHILVAENVPADADLAIKTLLEGEARAQVIVATDGQDALDYLHLRGRHRLREPHLPVLVLLNLELPKVDGLGVLRAIKNDVRLRTLPVIMLAGAESGDAAAASYRHGANAFIVKPTGGEAFRGILRVLARFWTTVNVPPPGDVAHAA